MQCTLHTVQPDMVFAIFASARTPVHMQTDELEWTASDVFAHLLNVCIFVLFRICRMHKGRNGWNDETDETLADDFVSTPSQAVSIKLQFQLNCINRKIHCDADSDSIVHLNFAFSSCSDDKFYYAQRSCACVLCTVYCLVYTVHRQLHRYRIHSHRSISLLILIEFFNMFAHIFTHYCFVNRIKCWAQTAWKLQSHLSRVRWN